MSDVTVSKDTFDSHDMAPDAVYDKLVFVVDDAEKFKAPGTYNRYIKEALIAYAREKNLYPDSTLDAVQQHMATHPGSWRHGTSAYIMKQCELQKYPFRSFADSLPMQDLIDYAQASRQRARVSNNNAVIKKARSMPSTAIPTIARQSLSSLTTCLAKIRSTKTAPSSSTRSTLWRSTHRQATTCTRFWRTCSTWTSSAPEPSVMLTC